MESIIKRALLITFSLLVFYGVSGQRCDGLLVDHKTSTNEQLSAIYTDTSGVIVFVGYHSATTSQLITENSQQVPYRDTVTSTGLLNNSLYLALKDPGSGSAYRWVKTFSYTGSVFPGDVFYWKGSTFMCGYFDGSITIGSTVLTTAGQRDAFLAKFDENGDLLWAISEGGPNYDHMRGIVADDANVYVSGYYTDGANFSGTILSSQIFNSLLVASYETTTGALNWIQTINGSVERDEASKITMGKVGDLYVAGYTNGGAFYNGTIPINSNGGRDAMVVKLDTLGNIDWVTTFGGVTNDGVNDIAYDHINDVIGIAGSYSSSFTVQGNALPTYGSEDAYIGQMNTAGDLLWLTTAGSAGNDWFNGFDITVSGDYVGSGIASGVFTSGANSSTYPGGVAVSYMRTNSSGVVQDIQTYGGIGSDASTDLIAGKSAADDGTVYIVGEYQTQAIFGADTFQALAGTDGFLWSLCAEEPICNQKYYQLSSALDDETTVVHTSEDGFTVLGGNFSTGSAQATLTNNSIAPFTDQQTLSNASTTSALYVSLLDSTAGSNVLWTTIFPCSGFNVLDEAVYKNGAIYVVGYFDGSLTVGGNTLVCPGSVDGFLIKLDAANGNVLWYKHLTGTGWERILEVVADDDNVYVVGYNENNATFGDSSLTSLFNTDAFAASIEQTTGTINWISPIHGATGKLSYNSLALGSGELYGGGICDGVLQYNGGTATADVSRDGFVMKMDTATGVVQWLNVIGGTDSDGSQDMAFSETDQLLYMLAVYSSTDIAPMGAVLPYKGAQDVFLLAIDPAGQYQWIKTYGSTGLDDFRDVVALPSGGCALTGFVDGDLIGDVDTVQVSSAGNAVVYMKFGPNGDLLESASYGGSGVDYGYNISCHESSSDVVSITISGSFEDQVNIGGHSFVSQGGKDGFAYTFCSDITAPQPSGDDVWPGDADYNGIANNWDILPIGLIYGSTGPVRPSASNVWVGQPAADWGAQFLNGADYKHTDCDGNGVVGLTDIVPILLNYSETHPKQQLQQQQPGPLLYVTLDADSVMAGDTALFQIDLGVPSNIAQSIYGIAFTINYLPELVVQGSFTTDYAGSWLGDLSVNMEKLDIELFSQGKLDVGMTRVNKTSMSGAGELMSVSVITIDNISGKDLQDRRMPIWISDVKMINENGVELAVDTEGDTLTIVDIEVGIGEEDARPQFIMYPNPANEKLTIRAGNQIEAIVVYNVLGQKVLELSNVNDKNYLLDISRFETGIHYIEVTSQGLSQKQRLMILR